jgi:hypothetical protein
MQSFGSSFQRDRFRAYESYKEMQISPFFIVMHPSWLAGTDFKKGLAFMEEQ